CIATSLARAPGRVSARDSCAHGVAVEIGAAYLPRRIGNDLLCRHDAELDEFAHEMAADAGVLRGVAHREPLRPVRSGRIGADVGFLAVRLDTSFAPR